MSRITVYIASPYTLGDCATNVKRQIDMADKLMDYGFAPFVPLYYHFQHMFHPKSYELWLELDFVWISKCDCLLRLDGESEGADMEVGEANRLGIPVFYTEEALLEYYKNNN